MSKKVVLVTGASSGFGNLAVNKMLDKGYIVYAAARRTDRMRGLEEKGAKLISMDVTNDEQVTNGIEKIVEQQGRIDGLVNNAGYGGYGMIESVSMDEAHKQFEVNVFGLARVTKAVLPYMRKQKSGNIVNISSVAGKISFPMGGWYTASKHAVEALSDALRSEVARFGIKVAIIEPSAVQTEFLDRAMEKVDEVEHDKAYKKQVEGFKESFSKSYANAPGPEETANAIVDAVSSDKPKIRYKTSGAGAALMLKGVLSDKMLDNVMTNVMGQK